MCSKEYRYLSLNTYSRNVLTERKREESRKIVSVILLSDNFHAILSEKMRKYL